MQSYKNKNYSILAVKFYLLQLQDNAEKTERWPPLTRVVRCPRSHRLERGRWKRRVPRLVEGIPQSRFNLGTHPKYTIPSI